MSSSKTAGVSIEDDDHMQRGRHGGRRNRNDRKTIYLQLRPKAQLVGMHELVRSDIEGNSLPTSSVQSHRCSLGTSQWEAKWVVTAANPNAEDAVELLRMCLQCGIPKTYSNS